MFVSEIIRKNRLPIFLTRTYLSDLFEYHKHHLNALIKMSDDDAQKVFHEALHALYPHLKNSNATFCKALLEVKYTQIKDACTLAIKDSTPHIKLSYMAACMKRNIGICSTILKLWYASKCSSNGIPS